MTSRHLAYYLVFNSRQYLTTANIKCNNLKAHMIKLIQIYAISELIKDHNSLYSCGYFGLGHRAQLYDTLKQLVNEVRPQAVSLAEAFDIPDFTLNSSIGN